MITFIYLFLEWQTHILFAGCQSMYLTCEDNFSLPDKQRVSLLTCEDDALCMRMLLSFALYSYLLDNFFVL